MEDKTRIAVDVFNKRAERYQDKFMDTSLYHDAFNVFCDHIPVKGAHILDVACGPGNVTKYVLQRRPDLRILGIDLAPNMIALAQANNPGVSFQLMDIRQIAALPQKYEGIMCGFGLPFLSKEEVIRFIADAANMLNARGVLYISTMEDDYNKSGFQFSSSGDRVYVYYHEEGYLKTAVEENHLTIIDVKHKQYRDVDGTVINDLIIIAVKQ